MSEATPRLRKIPWRERLGPLWDEFEWLVVGGVAAAALILGYIGFGNQPGEELSPLDRLYRSLQLFVLEYGSDSEPASRELDVARVLAPLVTFYAATRALTAIFRNQLQLLRLRLTRKERVVVCGLGRKGLLLAKAFTARGCRVAVIERDEENDRIESCREDGIAVLIGDATDPALLRKAHVDKARYLISVCGSDGTNADIAAHAREIARERSPRNGILTAFAHVVDLELCRLLRDRLSATERSDAFRLELFNVFESGARTWLSEHPPFGEAGEDRDGRPHLLLVGAGQMGMSLVVGAARHWLTLHAGSGRHPRVTIVDLEAERRKESLLLRFPKLGEICDLVPVTTDVTWPEFDEGRFLRGWDGRCDVTTIYVCLDDDARGVAAALALHEQVREDDVPIVVRTAEAAGLAAVIHDFENVRAFPLLDRTCTPEMLLGETPAEMLARGIHEEYVRHEREAGRTPADNAAMVDWHILPEGLKESNRRQADHIAVKLRAVGYAPLTEGGTDRVVFSPAEVELLAEMEHARLMAERLLEGWTHSPGPKDLVRRTSPELVSWDELDEDHKRKDRDAVRDLPALLAKAGFRVYSLSESASPERTDDDGNQA